MIIENGKPIYKNETEKRNCEFLKEYFNFSDADIVKIFNSRSTLIRRDPETVEILTNDLQEYLNVSRDVIAQMIKKGSTCLLPIDTIKSQISFIAKTFKLSEEKVKEIFIKFPALVTYKKETIISKIEEYKKLLDYSDKDLANTFEHIPNMLGYDIENFTKNVYILTNEFGYTKKQIKIVFATEVRVLTSKKVLRSGEQEAISKKFDIPRETLNKAYLKNPRAIGFTVQEFSDKIDSIQKMLNIQDKSKIVRKIINFIPLFTLHSETILKKADYYKLRFNLSKEELGKVFSMNASLITYKIAAVEEKISFYKEKLGLNEEQLRTAFIADPTIFDLDPESVADKIKEITGAGFTIDDIVNNIQMLTAGPANSFRLRYAICSNKLITDEEFLYKKLYMLNEKKLYARSKYIEVCDPKQNFSSLGYNEKAFQSKSGKTFEELSKRYPLTDEVKAEILDEFDLNQKRKKSIITVS